MRDVISLFDAARRDGVDVQANVYPYTRGNNDLVSIVPPWAHQGGKTELVARLKDPALRERLKGEIRSGIPGWYNHYTAVGGDWKCMLLSAQLSPANQRFQGQTMDAVIAAKTAGQTPAADPLDVLLDFLVEENGSVSTIYAHHTEDDMNLALVQPWCSIGSDGSALATAGTLRRGHPHPRNFGTFPRVLGEYVRKRGLLRLEDVVRKMTSLNAAKAGLRDRGLLLAGQFADVTVFDRNAVIDRSTYLDPFHYSAGIVWVMVNGRFVIENGQVTAARPGRGLRRGHRG
jgi:N-acyl-D-amino-acid deacylase